LGINKIACHPWVILINYKVDLRMTPGLSQPGNGREVGATQEKIDKRVLA
jgi:hypothetical protein